jgi:hypothetical protein
VHVPWVTWRRGDASPGRIAAACAFHIPEVHRGWIPPTREKAMDGWMDGWRQSRFRRLGETSLRRREPFWLMLTPAFRLSPLWLETWKSSFLALSINLGTLPACVRGYGTEPPNLVCLSPRSQNSQLHPPGFDFRLQHIFSFPILLLPPHRPFWTLQSSHTESSPKVWFSRVRTRCRVSLDTQRPSQELLEPACNRNLSAGAESR